MKKLSLVRFGFIGAGQIAYSAADSVRKNEKALLYAAFDTHAGRLAKFAGEKGIAKTYDTVEALLADPQLDAVYIATPNKFHAPLAKQALLAGKHVIVEKPLAMNYAEACEVVDLARECKRVFTVGMNTRFSADSQRIKQLVQDGVLGDIYHAKAYWCRRNGIPALGSWFSSKALAGGGALYDIGVHVLDLCLFMMDNYEPVSVSGATYTKFGNRGLGEGGWGLSEKGAFNFDVDDFASAFIRFANGATVSLEASWALHTHSDSREDVELFGTQAGASLRPAMLYRFGDANSLSKYEVARVDKTPLFLDHCDRFHNFINHLAGEESLCVQMHQALVVQRLLDAIALSSQRGCEVRIDEIV